ncbi:GNAT family N-acetyltransferase [Solibacillus daqui]|uniref:GNAT family N-acetyltransferase n=1 Tax=Solibacillus daqui TaxID=2912187 RepID=UPI0023670334|nr:GNAT family N-acetyltransferase [Solibacillus daqui]
MSNKQLVKLRSISLDDYTVVLTWSKDHIFCLANGWEINRQEKELRQWWKHCVMNKAKDFLRLGIETSDRLIGYVDLACIEGNTTEFGIAIGDRNAWGKGFGSQAALSLFEFASIELGITRFTAETHEANIRSRRMLQKLGFQEVSRIGTERYLEMDSALIQYEMIFN